MNAVMRATNILKLTLQRSPASDVSDLQSELEDSQFDTLVCKYCNYTA
jgi:hypothetical protein